MFVVEGKWPSKVEQTGSTLGLSEIRTADTPPVHDIHRQGASALVDWALLGYISYVVPSKIYASRITPSSKQQVPSLFSSSNGGRKLFCSSFTFDREPDMGEAKKDPNLIVFARSKTCSVYVCTYKAMLFLTKFIPRFNSHWYHFSLLMA